MRVLLYRKRRFSLPGSVQKKRFIYGLVCRFIILTASSLACCVHFYQNYSVPSCLQSKLASPGAEKAIFLRSKFNLAAYSGPTGCVLTRVSYVKKEDEFGDIEKWNCTEFPRRSSDEMSSCLVEFQKGSELFNASQL